MHVAIRKWTMADLESLVKYADNKKISDNLADGFPHPYTIEDGKTFIEKVSQEDPTKIFAVLADDQVVGSIGIFPDTDIHRKNAAVAYWIAEPYWGKGIALQAIRLILDYASKTFDITRVYAKPYGRNPNSHRVLEKAGFTLEATLHEAIFKNGEYLDELIYSRRLEK